MTHSYFQNQFASADDTSACDAAELKWELDEDLFVVVFRFLSINRGAKLGCSGIYAIQVVFVYLVMIRLQRIYNF